MTAPDAIRRFVDATNAGDTEAFLATFAADPFFSDWGRSFTGRDGIARGRRLDDRRCRSGVGRCGGFLSVALPASGGERAEE